MRRPSPDCWSALVTWPDDEDIVSCTVGVRGQCASWTPCALESATRVAGLTLSCVGELQGRARGELRPSASCKGELRPWALWCETRRGESADAAGTGEVWCPCRGAVRCSSLVRTQTALWEAAGRCPRERPQSRVWRGTVSARAARRAPPWTVRAAPGPLRSACRACFGLGATVRRVCRHTSGQSSVR